MGKSSKGIQVYEIFKKYLDDNKIKFEAHDDDLVLTMTINGDDLPQPTMIVVIDDREVIQIISPIPGNIREDKRVDAAIAVSVANDQMINGCFDFDISNGRIQFRLAQSYSGMEPSEELIKYMIGVTFFTTDNYNDKFFMLGKGMMSLEEFIEKSNKH